MAKLRTALAARDDIRGIRNYSKLNFGGRVVQEYLTGLSATFDLIEARPAIGALEHDLGENVRSFAFRSHRIYYRPDGDGLLVLRVLHQSRDIAQAFKSD